MAKARSPIDLQRVLGPPPTAPGAAPPIGKAKAKKIGGAPPAAQPGVAPPGLKAVQVIYLPRCPRCGGLDLDHKGTRGSVEADGEACRYYHCRVCVDPETGSPVAFKVLVR
jgi:hypothetical protein